MQISLFCWAFLLQHFLFLSIHFLYSSACPSIHQSCLGPHETLCVLPASSPLMKIRLWELRTMPFEWGPSPTRLPQPVFLPPEWLLEFTLGLRLQYHHPGQQVNPVPASQLAAACLQSPWSPMWPAIALSWRPGHSPSWELHNLSTMAHRISRSYSWMARWDRHKSHSVAMAALGADSFLNRSWDSCTSWPRPSNLLSRILYSGQSMLPFSAREIRRSRWLTNSQT